MRVAIVYTRVSTGDQVKGLSLDSQEEACKEYANRNGFIIREVFREEGETAKTADRKQLIKLLDYCKKYKAGIDALIVWKVDRFARCTEDHLTLKAYLARLGVSLLSVTEPIEDSTTGRLMETMLAAFAQFDNEVRAERATNGLNGRADQGGWISRPPLGYLNTRDEVNRPTLMYDPVRSPLIIKVFCEYATGKYTLKSISAYAYGIGLRTLFGKRIHPQPMLRILRNKAYLGYRKDRMSGGWKKALHPALIDEDVFDEVQAVLDGKRKEFKLEKDREWPLRTFVTCAVCKNPITGAKVKGRNRYYAKYSCAHCRTSQTGKPTSVDREDLHKEFIELLQSIQLRKHHAELFKRVVIDRWEAEHKTLVDDRKRVERELQTLNSRRERVLEMFIDGNLTREEKEQQFEKIDGERVLLRIQHSELQQDTDDREEVLEVAVEVMSNIAPYWERSPLEVQRRFQKLVFPDGISYDFQEGFGTAKMAPAYEVNVAIQDSKNQKLVNGWG